ncbi:MAG: glycosyltransferase family 87 protein [Candidatus Aceula meridiana]|nr:glycosyltransferase family 87 protein [Candidatus Aceula meridiana]
MKINKAPRPKPWTFLMTLLRSKASAWKFRRVAHPKKSEHPPEQKTNSRFLPFLRRMDKKWAAILFLCFLFTGLFFRYLNRAPKRHFCDFRVYHATAEKFLNGANIYERNKESVTPYKYSPTFAFLFSFLGWFSIKTSSLVFFSLNFIFLLVLFRYSQKIIDPELSFNKCFWLFFWVFAPISRFAFQVLDSGQVNIIMAGLVVLGLYFADRDNNIAAGMLLSLSIFFKYMPALLIPYFLFKKKFRLLGWLFLFGIAFMVLPLIYTGAEKYLAYTKDWLPSIVSTSLDHGSLIDYKNQSLYSIILRFFCEESPYKIKLMNLTFQSTMRLSTIACFVLYLFALYPLCKNRKEQLLDTAMLLICMALFNPNAWMINFVSLTFAYMLILYLFIQNKKLSALIIFVIAFLLGSFFGESVVGNDLENFMEEASSVTLSSLVLFFYLFYLKINQFIELQREKLKSS